MQVTWSEDRFVVKLQFEIFLVFLNVFVLFSPNKYFIFQKHRVVIPDESKLRNRSRHSVAFFVHPDNDTVIEPSLFEKSAPVEEVEGPKRTVAFLTAYQHLQNRLKQSYE